MNISFIIPAFNCAKTLKETCKSIFDGNFFYGDEVIIVDDGSTDNTREVIKSITQQHPEVRTIQHSKNKGGGATRNTAVESAINPLIFCIDSDNVLSANSISFLKEFMLHEEADIAVFNEIRFFQFNKHIITHKWVFNPGLFTIADCLAGPIIPGSSGNYLYSKKCWEKANGYPEFVNALDTWGFGFRQLATGSKMAVYNNLFYYHRYGNSSYWTRNSDPRKNSLSALQIILPYLDLIEEEYVEYLFSKENRFAWFDNLETHPIKLKNHPIGKQGKSINNHRISRYERILLEFLNKLKIL